jgi:membrane fusion protein (multidrug efflux system)
MEEVRTRKPRRTLLWSALGTLVVVLAVVGVFIAQNANGSSKNDKDKKKGKKGEEAVAAPVELTAVTRGGISTWLQTTTTLEARNEATLVARAQGQVVELPADEGRWVEKGATLARLDDTEARLGVRRAELALEVAARELERANTLVGQGFLSQKELDDLQLKQRTAEVVLEEARYALSQTRVTAPFSGRVTSRMIKLGETVTVGRDCFHVVDFDPLLAHVYFPERELSKVRVGQTAMLSFDAQPGQEVPARVSIVNPVVDRANGTFRVTLEVSNNASQLRPGAFARVKLRTASLDQALLIPRRGVLSEDGESYVFIARGDSCVRQAVKVGAVEDEIAQILDGLKPGDSVVTVGQSGLKPGARIRSIVI